MYETIGEFTTPFVGSRLDFGILPDTNPMAHFEWIADEYGNSFTEIDPLPLWINNPNLWVSTNTPTVSLRNLLNWQNDQVIKRIEVSSSQFPGDMTVEFFGIVPEPTSILLVITTLFVGLFCRFRR